MCLKYRLYIDVNMLLFADSCENHLIQEGVVDFNLLYKNNPECRKNKIAIKAEAFEKDLIYSDLHHLV